MLLVLALPHPPYGNTAGVAWVAGVSFAVGLGIWALQARLRERHLFALLVLAIGLITACIAFSGQASSPIAVQYVLASAFAGNFLARRQVAVLVGVVSLAYAGVLWGADPASEPLARFMLTVSVLAAVTLSVLHLRERLGVLLLAAEAQARTDPLTGLANRRGLDEVLEQETARALRRAEPLSVVVADIDRFKAINDEHGHPVGDKVLVELGGLIRCLVRPFDAVARLGGEEFAIVLPNCSSDQAVEIAGRIRAEVEGRLVVAGTPVTVSLGTASSEPGAGWPIDSLELLRRADSALYVAKRLGRNRVACETANSPGERAGLPVEALVG